MKFRQPKAYKPTLTSVSLKISGEPSKFKTMSGIGIRPIKPEKKKKKEEEFKGLLGGIKIR